jgi:hypothetical protein
MAIGKTLLPCRECRVKRLVWLPLRAAIRARTKAPLYVCLRCSPRPVVDDPKHCMVFNHYGAEACKTGGCRSCWKAA